VAGIVHVAVDGTHENRYSQQIDNHRRRRAHADGAGRRVGVERLPDPVDAKIRLDRFAGDRDV
jgi:hypothetical protein